MNSCSKMIVTASVFLSMLAPAASSYATSMGTKSVRTAGGRNNIIKLSVVSANTALPRSQEVARALTGNITGNDRSLLVNQQREWPTVKNVMTFGLKVPNPAIPGLEHLGARMEISPIKEGHPALVTPHETKAIAERITGEAAAYEGHAVRLHQKAEITDAQLNQARNFVSSWRTVAAHFEGTSKILGEHKVAVNIKE